MSKFQGAAQSSSPDVATSSKIIAALKDQSQASTPVEQAPAPVSGTPEQVSDPSLNLAGPAPTQQVGGEVLPTAPTQLDPQQQLEATLQEQDRQAVPDLRERWSQPKAANPVAAANASAKGDGGIITRANDMANAVQTGGLMPAVSLANTAGFIPARDGADGPAVAEEIAKETEGTLQAAMARVNALNLTDPRNPQIDPDFVKAASLTTENTIMHLAGGANVEGEFENDPITEAWQNQAEPNRVDRGKPKRVPKQGSNAAIGQQIVQEFQRLKGVPEPAKIPPKEAETLGDAFKMMWAAQNPDLARVVRDPKDNQKYIELTPTGEDVLATGQSDRARLFPSKNVKPAKTPLKTGFLPGDTGANVVKRVQGGVGKQDFSETHEEAMKNLAQVPNVVDKQRMKILYATALPILQNLNNPETFSKWQADINNLGLGKMKKYEAKHGPDVAREEMVKAGQKLANEIRSIAQERKGANYLSYAIQGFQGRISPQQSYFNPTTSKAVRFVTTNAVPAPAKPGSRVERNLRQMYAMMLVKGADGMLPPQREIMLEGATAKLETWGARIEEAMQMTDAEAEAISQAIEAGTPLTDPSFPQIKGLELDPQKDAELIDTIASKGEDGPHFIDGLLDFAAYSKAKKDGKTHHSYFNAYIDGKTNGIASNGIQMGISQTAQRTGVFRDSDTDYLDTEGDIRDVLKSDLLFSLDNNGFDGNVWAISSELTAVGRAVFSHRDLNKKTTMTFGYGKEVNTFGQDMYDTAMEMKANPAMIKDPQIREEFMSAIDTVEAKFPDQREFGETFMSIYGPALEGVMSKEALLARDIMRGAAIMHAATNQIFSIKGPTGMDLNFGRDVQTGETTENRYRLKGDKVAGGEQQFASTHQQTTPSAAAPRSYQNAETGETKAEYGDYAYGGSVVGPVQALDAATVSKTAAGKSWKRMKQASNGNPYMHTIYDAFKCDAMGYDVMLEEVNENWLNTSMEWSYLQETLDSVKQNKQAFKEEMAGRDPNGSVKPGEDVYLKFIMEPVVSNSGKPWMKNFVKKVGTASSAEKLGIDMMKQSYELANKMRDVGYDWQNPPEQVTNRQLSVFVGFLDNTMNSESRLKKAVAHTNKNKVELKKEILKKGYKTPNGKTIALQYYAH